MLRRNLSVVFFAAGLLAQSDPEDFRVEATLGVWRHNTRGQLQSGALPIDLHADLFLFNRSTFDGRVVVKPGRKHRIFVEGNPFRLEGQSLLSRSLIYEGRTYSFRETVVSNADLTYIAAGYQYDFLSSTRGHLGVQAAGAYLSATGTLASGSISATGSYTLGMPLAGIEGRAFLLPGSRLLNINGEVKGMAFGDYGHFVQTGANLGLTFGPVSLQGGYRILDADLHRRDRLFGVVPRFRGPAFSLQFRK